MGVPFLNPVIKIAGLLWKIRESTGRQEEPGLRAA